MANVTIDLTVTERGLRTILGRVGQLWGLDFPLEVEAEEMTSLAIR